MSFQAKQQIYIYFPLSNRSEEKLINKSPRFRV